MVDWKHNPCGLMAEPPAELSDGVNYTTNHLRKATAK